VSAVERGAADILDHDGLPQRRAHLLGDGTRDHVRIAPAANGTIKVTGRFGKSCAQAAVTTNVNAATTASSRFVKNSRRAFQMRHQACDRPRRRAAHDVFDMVFPDGASCRALPPALTTPAIDCAAPLILGAHHPPSAEQ